MKKIIGSILFLFHIPGILREGWGQWRDRRRNQHKERAAMRRIILDAMEEDYPRTAARMRTRVDLKGIEYGDRN